MPRTKFPCTYSFTLRHRLCWLTDSLRVLRWWPGAINRACLNILTPNSSVSGSPGCILLSTYLQIKIGCRYQFSFLLTPQNYSVWCVTAAADASIIQSFTSLYKHTKVEWSCRKIKYGGMRGMPSFKWNHALFKWRRREKKRKTYSSDDKDEVRDHTLTVTLCLYQQIHWAAFSVTSLVTILKTMAAHTQTHTPIP